jgi:hypothetical protein
METEFWFTDIFKGSGIQEMLEKIDTNISFKNVDTDVIDSNKLNLLVFVWETSPKLPYTTYTTSDEFIDLLKKLQDKKFYFMADFSREAHKRVDNLSLSFLNKLKSNGIDINRLVLVKNDSSKIGLHKMKYENFTLNTFFFPHFFLSTYNHLNQYINPVSEKPKIEPDKKFLCLNRRVFYHKYQIIEELFKRGLLDETRLTWVDNYTPLKMIDLDLAYKLKINGLEFKSIQLEGDVMYGSRLSYHDEFLFTINPEWYYKSKVDIITETMLYDEAIHITEKTYKSIYLGLPFVVSATKGHLKHLRDMGFKTFNSVINEDYDVINNKHKVKHVVDAAIELSNVYNKPEVLEICKFNKELYSDVDFRKKICKKYFLDKLVDIPKKSHPNSLI